MDMNLLCRKDEFRDAIPYPFGGIVWRGQVHKEYRDLYLPFGIDIADDIVAFANDNANKYYNKSLPAKVFRKFLFYLKAAFNYLYPWFSFHFPFISKIFSGIPDYIIRENSLSEDDIKDIHPNN